MYIVQDIIYNVLVENEKKIIASAQFIHREGIFVFIFSTQYESIIF